MKNEKLRVTSAQIIVTGTKEKPYYEIKYREVGKENYCIGYSSYCLDNVFEWLEECFDLVEDKNVEQRWILVSERLPKAEEEVLVTAICRYTDGGCRYIVIPALYEDGKMSECKSKWNWEDIDGEWDEENDCLIIPEGWWENRTYNPDCTYNCAVDDEVVAWMPLPEPYRESEGK